MKWFAVVIALVLLPLHSDAQNTVFTYQGRLTSGGKAANGTYDFRFTLMDSQTLGNVIAGPVTKASTLVSSGMFTASLSFPASAFNGSPRWLEVGVRMNESFSGYTTLSPRQAITPAPYATFASVAGVAASLSGGGSQLTNISASSLTWGTIPLSRLSGITTGQLDPQTVASLESATNGLFGNVISTNLSGTNVYARTLTASNLFVNSPGTLGPSGFYYGWTAITNGTIALPGWDFADTSTPNAAGQGIQFFNTNGTVLATIQVIDSHDGVNLPELQINSRKAIHIRPSVLQGGNGGDGYITVGNTAGYDSMVMQYASTYPSAAPGNSDGITTFPFGHSQIFGFAATSTNSAYGHLVYGKSGIVGFASTNRSYPGYDYDAAGGMIFYRHVPQLTSISPVNYTGGQIGGVMDTNGWNFRGNVIYSRLSLTTTNTCPIDFSLAKCLDISCGSPTVSFYTTNATGFSTNFEELVVIIRSRGFAPALSFPSGWNVMGPSIGTALPSSLSSGQMMELRIKSIGTGETNKLVTFSQGIDRTF